MSVLAELRDYERRVIERLNELKPLVEEYQELEQLATRLGLERTPAGAGAPRRPARARRAPGRVPQRREQVLRLVRAHPGITVPDIAKEIGVDPTGLYRVVRRLITDGLVTKSGMELSPKR